MMNPTPEEYDNILRRITRPFRFTKPFFLAVYTGRIPVITSVVIAIETRSLVPAILGLAYLVAYDAVSEVVIRTVEAKNLEDTLAGLDQILPQYNCVMHHPEDYVDVETLSLIMLRSRIVSTKPKDADTPPLGSMKAFVNARSLSLIFVPDSPTTINAYQRFFIYHEFGHLTRSAFFATYYLRYPLPRLLIIFGTLLCLSKDQFAQTASVLGAVIGWLAQSSDLVAETAADHFAVSRYLAVFGVDQALDVIVRVQKRLARSLSSLARGTDEYNIAFCRLRCLNTLEDGIRKNELWRFQVRSARALAGCYLFPSILAQIIVAALLCKSPRIPSWLEACVAVILAGYSVVRLKDTILSVDELRTKLTTRLKVLSADQSALAM